MAGNKNRADSKEKENGHTTIGYALGLEKEVERIKELLSAIPLSDRISISEMIDKLCEKGNYETESVLAGYYLAGKIHCSSSVIAITIGMANTEEQSPCDTCSKSGNCEGEETVRKLYGYPSIKRAE